MFSYNILRLSLSIKLFHLKEIGRDVEQKYWNEMLLEKEKALAEQKEMMEYVFRKEMKTIEQRVREEEQALCACMLEQLNCEFEIRLQNELKQLEHEMIEKSNQLLEEQREGIEKEWKEKLDNAVSATVKAMTAQFFEELQYQLQELIEHYENILKYEFFINIREVCSIWDVFLSENTYLLKVSKIFVLVAFIFIWPPHNMLSPNIIDHFLKKTAKFVLFF